MRTLSESLPLEIARVRTVLASAQLSCTIDDMPALVEMRADLDRAAQALIDGNPVTMLGSYRVLKGWEFRPEDHALKDLAPLTDSELAALCDQAEHEEDPADTEHYGHTCAHCGGSYQLRSGCDPTALCDDCGHKVSTLLARAVRQLLADRDDAIQRLDLSREGVAHWTAEAQHLMDERDHARSLCREACAGWDADRAIDSLEPTGRSDEIRREAMP